MSELMCNSTRVNVRSLVHTSSLVLIDEGLVKPNSTGVMNEIRGQHHHGMAIGSLSEYLNVMRYMYCPTHFDKLTLRAISTAGRNFIVPPFECPPEWLLEIGRWLQKKGISQDRYSERSSIKWSHQYNLFWLMRTNPCSAKNKLTQLFLELNVL